MKSQQEYVDYHDRLLDLMESGAGIGLHPFVVMVAVSERMQNGKGSTHVYETLPKTFRDQVIEFVNKIPKA